MKCVSRVCFIMSSSYLTQTGWKKIFMPHGQVKFGCFLLDSLLRSHSGHVRKGIGLFCRAKHNQKLIFRMIFPHFITLIIVKSQQQRHHIIWASLVTSLWQIRYLYPEENVSERGKYEIVFFFVTSSHNISSFSFIHIAQNYSQAIFSTWIIRKFMSCAACTTLDVIFTDFSEIYHTTAKALAVPSANRSFLDFHFFPRHCSTQLGSLRWISSADLELFHSSLLS